jgi:hypothetical protein
MLRNWRGAITLRADVTGPVQCVMKDRTGAVVADAKVVAANVQSNLTQQSLSGSDGWFSWRFLSAYTN